jgi:hypothetical protein
VVTVIPTALVAAMWAVPLVGAAVGFDHWRRARRTRRRTIEVLGIVPELACVVAPGTAERTAALAHALARRLGASRQEAAAAAAAARLRGLAALGDEDQVLTEGGISSEIGLLVREAVNAQSGEAGHLAAAVRVVHHFDSGGGDDPSLWPGALFRTVVEHSTGHERQAAQALAHLVRGGVPSA